MATTNDITGDKLINTPKTSPEIKRREFVFNMPMFSTYYCERCHISVSTNKDVCPCCGEKL